MFELIKLIAIWKVRQVLTTSNVLKSLKIFIFLAQKTVFCDTKYIVILKQILY